MGSSTLSVRNPRGLPAHAASLTALAVLAIAGSAHADTSEQCIAAFRLAQSLPDQRHLVEARDKARFCAQTACSATQRRCAEFVDALEKRVPTIIFSARDARGGDVPGARVLLDGKVLQDKIDGLAREIDPGPYKLRLEFPNGQAVEQDLVVNEAQKAVLVRVELPPPPPTPPVAIPVPPPPAPPALPPQPAAARPVWPWIAIGTGSALAVASIGTAVGWSGAKSAYKTDFQAQRCQANGTGCVDPGPVNADRSREILFGGLAVGFGAAAVTAATIGVVGIARGPKPTGVTGVRLVPFVSPSLAGLSVSGPL
jgi:hypothetical protein